MRVYVSARKMTEVFFLLQLNKYFNIKHALLHIIKSSEPEKISYTFFPIESNIVIKDTVVRASFVIRSQFKCCVRETT